MRKACVLIILLFSQLAAYCQSSDTSAFSLKVLDENLAPLSGATVQLLQNAKQLKAATSDGKGIAVFQNIPAGDYTFQVGSTGYQKRNTRTYHFPSNVGSDTVHLKTATNALQEVNITARRSYIQQKQGKTVINVDASPTNTGSTVLEVLEKSPGVNVDKDGNISMKGKSNVLVMIDDKPTYLSPGDLNNLLSSMSSTQVSQIELMPNPPAKYDASGNAGIINIKTKKNNQKGFNGSFTSSVGHGIHPKNGENLTMNYRNGKINTFVNYNFNYIKYITDLYALRKYYDANSGQLTSMLNQPSDFTGTFTNNTVKAGIDYYVSPKTTVGMIVGATAIHRAGNNYGNATWQEPSGVTDSTIITTNKNVTGYRNATLNLNAKHTISDKQDIAADFDLLRYQINTSEDFVNQFLGTGGYTEQSRGAIPTHINITSGKIDYSLKIGNGTFQAGAKTSHSATDNLASYQNLVNGSWVDDNTKNNHFLYDENIHAVYSSFDGKYGKVNMQAGVRYENTNYHADQLGNAIQKDSAFSRNYGGLFPSGNITYQADSSNSFTFTTGRRIDRPVYQTLNPFYFIINKYTYQTGNPFLLPQYSWNFELTHQYKELLTTTISYSIINNYFSQLFLADTARGVLLYSQGNVGHTNVLGLSSALSWSPFNWWQFNLQATYNHKELVGFNGNNYTSHIDQLSLNSSSQFTIGKVYTAEISGFYITKARQDIQELQYPTGQLSLGISRPLLKKKATLKLTARDILYTSAFSGFTNFPNATEYFKITRDTRVVTLAFTYRFGKAFKTVNKSEGSAADEAGRVGNS